MPIRKRLSSAFKKSLGGSDKPESNITHVDMDFKSFEPPEKDAKLPEYASQFVGGLQPLNPDEPGWNRIVVPMSCCQGGTSQKNGYIFRVPETDIEMVLNTDDFRALPEDKFGKDFAKDHVCLQFRSDVKELPRVYRYGYDQMNPGKSQSIDVGLVADMYTKWSTRDIIGDKALAETCGKNSFSLRPLKSCRDGYDCIAKTMETGVSPYKSFQDSVQAAFKEMNARREAKSGEQSFSDTPSGVDKSDKPGMSISDKQSGGDSVPTSKGSVGRSRDMRDLDAAVQGLSGPSGPDMGPEY